MNKFYITLFALALPISSYSHSGGTNQEGCHVNRTTGFYHCHKPKTVNQLENWCISQNGRILGCGYSSYNSCSSAAAFVDFGICVKR
tara:strand:- start:195 stop:455 length:261 start_codon:yes stop_codon:yes gene_type:complete